MNKTLGIALIIILSLILIIILYFGIKQMLVKPTAQVEYKPDLMLQTNQYLVDFQDINNDVGLLLLQGKQIIDGTCEDGRNYYNQWVLIQKRAEALNPPIALKQADTYYQKAIMDFKEGSYSLAQFTCTSDPGQQMTYINQSISLIKEGSTYIQLATGEINKYNEMGKG